MRPKKQIEKACDLPHPAIGELRGDKAGKLYVPPIGKSMEEGHRIAADESGESSLLLLIYELQVDLSVSFRFRIDEDYAGTARTLSFHSMRCCFKWAAISRAASFDSSHSATFGSTAVA